MKEFLNIIFSSWRITIIFSVNSIYHIFVHNHILTYLLHHSYILLCTSRSVGNILGTPSGGVQNYIHAFEYKVKVASCRRSFDVRKRNAEIVGSESCVFY